MSKNNIKPIYLGLDGGGTKTLCIVSDEQGLELGRGYSGPSNYLVSGRKRAMQEIKKAIELGINASNLKDYRIISICAGLAGVGSDKEKTFWKQFILANTTASDCLVVEDAFIALIGAVSRKYGVVVVGGTGSIAMGIDSNKQVLRIGGWGYILGDEGSGFDIGKKAMVSILRQIEGRGAITQLTDSFQKYKNLKDVNLFIRNVYKKRNKTREYLCSLVGIVEEAAKKGDQVSLKILEDAGRNLANLAIELIINKGCWLEDVPVALTGGIANIKIVRDSFVQEIYRLSNKIEIVNPLFEPARGAVMLALENSDAILIKS